MHLIQKSSWKKWSASLACILLLAGLALTGSCQNTNKRKAGETKKAYTEAIKSILAQDEELGAIRNHACEDTSLSTTIQEYVTGIEALDFSGCPEAFTHAFRKHQQAWAVSIGFFAQFDERRGEMHELFAAIEEEQPAAYQEALQPIMDTWEEVEAAAREYGALAEE